MFLNLTDNAPTSLDTLNEINNSLADDAKFATASQNQLALKASSTYVDSQLALKQPTRTPATKLAINKLITITWESPTGFMYVQIKAYRFLGNTIWLSATSTAVKFWSVVYAEKGTRASNGITIGIGDP